MAPKLARGKTDQLSLRSDSLTAIKRRSWAQTEQQQQPLTTNLDNSQDYNIWRYLVDEQKKGRTHISFADISAAKRATTQASTSATFSSGTKAPSNINNNNNVCLFYF